MTEIHALGGLSAQDRGHRPQPDGGGRSPFLVALSVSTVILTVLNLAAAVYLFKAMGEVRGVEKRLAELAEVEARIKARLDGMNNGLQSQFDEQNVELDARFDVLERRFDVTEKRLDDLRSLPAADPGAALALPAGIELPSPLNDVTVEDPIVAAKPPVAGPVRGRSVAYERFETADGKVYYRKVR